MSQEQPPSPPITYPGEQLVLRPDGSWQFGCLSRLRAPHQTLATPKPLLELSSKVGERRGCEHSRAVPTRGACQREGTEGGEQEGCKQTSTHGIHTHASRSLATLQCSTRAAQCNTHEDGLSQPPMTAAVTAVAPGGAAVAATAKQTLEPATKIRCYRCCC